MCELERLRATVSARSCLHLAGAKLLPNTCADNLKLYAVLSIYMPNYLSGPGAAFLRRMGALVLPTIAQGRETMRSFEVLHKVALIS